MMGFGKKRKLKDILNDIKITAMRIEGFKYVNADMVREALEYITSYKRYHENQADLIDEIDEVIEVLEKE